MLRHHPQHHSCGGEDDHKGTKAQEIREFERLPASVEQLATQVVDAGFKVHKTLGPGLLESGYVTCLAHELRVRGIGVELEVPIPLVYEGLHLDVPLRVDLLVENELLVEVKAVDHMIPVYDAQALTYLRLTGKRLCLLMNFNVPVFKHGVKRIIL